MNIKQIKQTLKNAGIEEYSREAEMFVEHFLNLDAVKLLLNPEFEPTKELLDAIDIRCKTKKPIQYILGRAYFMGEYFLVNEHTLIPRDETEILVRRAISIIERKNLKMALDVGTGTGCIPCIIAKNTNSKILSADFSKDALLVAIENANRLKVFDRVFFRLSDLFSNIDENEKFDLILSNPPYVPIKNWRFSQKEIHFEPKSAIFAPDDLGIDFYKKIIEGSITHLNKNGYILFELGINQSEIVKELMIQNGFCDILIEKDLAGIDRVISGRKDD